MGRSDRLDGLPALRLTGTDAALHEPLRRAAARRGARAASRTSPRARPGLDRAARHLGRSRASRSRRSSISPGRSLTSSTRCSATNRSLLLELQHWTDALGPWFGLVGSIFVVYGFLSERVIDFRFVIGRAAIYGSITAVLLLFFGILEWWAEQLFESTRPAIYLSLFAALFIGFSLNALHGRVEDFLEHLLLPRSAPRRRGVARTRRARSRIRRRRRR